jgi:hypothetical protein
MFKKFVHFQLIVGIMFSFLLLKAKEDVYNYQSAFYALSSLAFYLDDTIADISANKKSNVDKIHFDESDIAHLWDSAATYSVATSEIQKARNYYYEALNKREDQTAFIQSCKTALSIVEAIWYELNPYTVAEKPAADIRAVANGKYPNFDDNPYITAKMRKQMKPYLIPSENKLKAPLDKIFDSSRVIKDKKSFAKAGFIDLFHYQRHSLVTVAKHPALPGYLLKAYLDTDVIEGRPSWERLTRRCEGAENIRRLIKDKHLVRFSVPDKWLYLPSFSHIPSTAKPKSVHPVVLVVTNMKLVSIEESRKAWRKKVTRKHLDELYCILSHGFASKVLPKNIPYSKNGTFSCIDTEYPNRKYGNFRRIKTYLSPEMKAYWDQLVRKGGKI